MLRRHKIPSEHEKILLNLRKNPSNQQTLLFDCLKKVFGEKDVGCNDWNILDNKMEVDVPIYPYKIAIEWDGEYWHSKVNGAEKRDERKNRELIQRGWKVVRIRARSNPYLTDNEILDYLPKILSVLSAEKEIVSVKIG